MPIFLLRFGANLLGRFVWLRSATLGAARAGGRVRRWLSTGAPRVALVHAEAIILVALYYSFAAADFDQRWKYAIDHPLAMFRPPLLTGSLRWFFAGAMGPWVTTIAVAAILAALEAVRQARKHIVVVAFINLTGDDSRKCLADSLPRRLSNQLSDIADIFTHVSYDPADLSLEHEFPALALAVDPAAGVFAGIKASMKDQSVKVGFVNVPLDWAVTTLSTLVQGPQITGSVQMSGAGLVLEASLSGGGYNFSWRVGEQDVNADRQGKEADGSIVDRMIAQLGYRIFTDLNREEMGTREWRAAEHYIEGLRAFRTWRRQGESTAGLIALHSAQKEFFAACPEDHAFLRSRYNLGVIYSYQKVPQAAYAVFEEAINMTVGAAPGGLPGSVSYDRDRTDLAGTHYAAAIAARDLNRSQRVRYHCNLALQLDPWHAGAWRLRAGCERMHSHAPQPAQALADARTACSISWWNLCRAAWCAKVRSIEITRAASDCAQLALWMSGDRQSIPTMEQALRLHPEVSRHWMDLGRLRLALQDREGALRAFETANRESESALSWMWVAATRSELSDGARANRGEAEAWARAKAILEADPRQIRSVREFFKRHRAHHQGVTSRQVKHWRSELGSIVAQSRLLAKVEDELLHNKPLVATAGLIAGFDGTSTSITNWLAAQHHTDGVIRRLTPALLYRFLPQMAAVNFVNPGTVDPLPVVQFVVSSLRARPLGDVERFNLASLYRLLGLVDRAASESAMARSLDPTHKELRLQATDIARDEYNTVTDIPTRRKALRGAYSTLRELADDTTGKIWGLNLGIIPWLHFQLGVISYDLLDYTTAQKAFETSVAFLHRVPASLQWLALVHFRCGAFEEAERAYQRLLSTPVEDEVDEWEIDRKGYLAFAANHTAAAFAEQGLVAQALRRWSEGRAFTSGPKPVRYSEPALEAARTLCKGVILLSAAVTRTDVTKLVDPPFPVPETPGDQLKQAIEEFRSAFAPALDTALRADAFYRTAVACQELADLEPANAAMWRRRAVDALNRTETSDRRGEYTDRVAMLRSQLH